MQIEKPTYLDIGAHHPYQFSNTYYFYRLGCRGVCVEPNPLLHKAIKQHRTRDVCLNVGVGEGENENAEFYVVDPPTMSTFSKEDLKSYSGLGYLLKETLRVPLVTVDSILQEHFSEAPNLVSLDTEGFDDAILSSWKFDQIRPAVFCVETVHHASDAKLTSIHKLMEQNGYQVYADTYINTLFVEKERFANR